MATKTSGLKDQFSLKLLKIQMSGLEQYAKYLNQQLRLSKKHEHWEAYKKYIEKEIIRNDKKILSVKEKMK